MSVINLDHISANPLLPQVKEAMIEVIQNSYGNPSSLHQLGDKATEALAKAREAVACLLNSATTKEIIFTSCGTESINHALKGVAAANAEKGKHIVTSNIEHNAVLKTIRRMKMFGHEVTSVPVDEYGLVNPDDVAGAITDETILVSIMHSNNEIGTIQPIKEIAAIAHEKGVTFHTDAVVSVGNVPVDVQELDVDLLSFAANQFYGPAGIGGLYARKGTKVWPLIEGGGQEHNRRAGTENLIGIVGMGVAAELAAREMESRVQRTKELKEKLVAGLREKIDDIYINGHPERALPNLVSVSLKYIEGESIMLMLDEEDVVVSTRSACASGSLRASHVLSSIGMDWADAQGTLVLTFGHETTEEHIGRFLDVLADVTQTLRNMSPLYAKSKSS
jgi:cysteine desulfurase